MVAGDNLRIPLLGEFLQNAGAFYIRRAWGDDALYATVVQAYIDILLSKGYNFECFIEGTRSRTGKLLVPKVGMLRLLCNTILRGKARDCWILPVSVQYDRVIETESYVDELLGKPKEKETLWQLITGGGGKLSLKLGRIDVHFAEPWSLKQFLTEKYANKEYDRVLYSLGYKVLNNINAVTVIMPGALIGTVILTLRGRGVGRAELVRRVEWLRERIHAKGGRVAEFGNRSTEAVVNRALGVLRDLIGEVKGLAEPTFFARDRFQLSFYRNGVIHLFVSETIISVALYTKIKQGGGPTNQKISYEELWGQCEFLSQLLKTEFVFELARNLTDNIDKALAGLEADDVIVWHREEEVIELSQTERECGRENYDFYCFLVTTTLPLPFLTGSFLVGENVNCQIWPFIEAYYLNAVSLFALTPGLEVEEQRRGDIYDVKDKPLAWVSVKAFLAMAQQLGKTLFHQGDLSYIEVRSQWVCWRVELTVLPQAVNMETLRNALGFFEEQRQIVVRKTKSGRQGAAMTLHPDWVPRYVSHYVSCVNGRRLPDGSIAESGKLWNLVERISISRREGKNR